MSPIATTRGVLIAIACAAMVACQLMLDLDSEVRVIERDPFRDAASEAAVTDAPSVDGATGPDTAVPTDPCDAATACPFATGLVGPFGVATDATEVFVSENGGGRIVAFPLAGGAKRVIATDVDAPAHLAVDDAYVYFGSTNAHPVRRVPKSGVGGAVDFADCAGTCRGVAVLGGSVMFTERSLTGSRIIQKNATGGFVVSEGLVAADGIGTRDRNLPFAFADEGADAVYVRGGTSLTLAVPGPGGVAVGGSDVWFTLAAPGVVMRCDLDAGPEGAARTVATGQPTPRGIAVAGTRVFWANFGAGTLMQH